MLESISMSSAGGPRSASAMGRARAGAPLRLMVYDRTCVKHGIGLSTAWWLGARLYQRIDRFDATLGVCSWNEALSWLAAYEPSRPIGEIQYWGHGRWGRVFVDGDVFDAAALGSQHSLHAPLLAVRERLLPDGRALVWLRTCEAFGARLGIDFAQALADTLGAKVAGHTHVIGAVQSGLRALAPGCRPTWDPTEGLAEGTPDAPRRAFSSGPFRPRTITCLANEVPRSWFDEDGATRTP